MIKHSQTRFAPMAQTWDAQKDAQEIGYKCE